MTEKKNGEELLLNFRQEGDAKRRNQVNHAGGKRTRFRTWSKHMVQTYENKRLGRGNSENKGKQTSAMHLKE